MRNHFIKCTNLAGQRRAVIRRLRQWRLREQPVCHIALADDDYDLLKKTSVILSYKTRLGILVVPLSEMSAHRASGRCCAVSAQDAA